MFALLLPAKLPPGTPLFACERSLFLFPAQPACPVSVFQREGADLALGLETLASFSALRSQRQTPRPLIRRRIAFCITRDDLLSSQPSAIQAMDAARKITKPATVIRAFTFAATIPAPSTVKQAAIVLRVASTSMFMPHDKGLLDGQRQRRDLAKTHTDDTQGVGHRMSMG